MNRTPLLALVCFPALYAGMAHSGHAGVPVPQFLAQTAPYSFPRSPERIQYLLNRKLEDESRVDAWSLFAAMTSTGVPRWESERWDTKCNVDLTHENDLCKHYGLGISPADAGHNLPVSSVYYSPSASAIIKSAGLDNGQILQTMIRSGAGTLPDTTFPRDAVVVKELWEGFNEGGTAPKTVHVFDKDAIVPTPPDNNQLPQITEWKNAAVIDNDRNAPCKSIDYAAGKDGMIGPVPLNCFYHRSSGTKRCDTITYFRAGDSPVGGRSLLPTSPCTLVLVAIQIITKESPQWTWNAYWWTNRYNGWKTENRPKLSDPFSHFAMDTMIGSTSPSALPVYNPYIEGSKLKGVTDNCLRCHSRAAFASNCPSLICSNNAGTRIGIHNPEREIPSSAPLNHCTGGNLGTPAKPCQLQTGFLWSIATNQDLTSAAPPF